MIKILYVDDEPLLLNLARLFIEKNDGFTVDTAESAPAALELMKTCNYDTVISDYQMPGMNGIEFLKTIRHSGDRIPFIIFTGKGREEIVIQAFENGADFYIQKGGEPNPQFVELLHKVRQAIALRQTEAALRDSEEKYRLLVEKANEAIFIAQDHLIRFSNPRFTSIIDISSNELIGKPIDDIIHPDDRDMVIGRYELRIAGKDAPEEYEFRVLDSSGAIHWVKIHASRIQWEEKPALLIILDEITSKKESEEALIRRNEELTAAYEQLAAMEEELRQGYDELEKSHRDLEESEDKFRNLVENAPIGIFTSNSDGELLTLNKTGAKILGFSSPSEITGKAAALTDILNVDPGRGILLRETLIEKGYAEDFNLKIIRPGEMKKRCLSISARISQSKRDSSFIIQGFFADVDDLKNFQEALENANHQLKLLNSITRHDILNSVMAAYCFIELLNNPEDPEYEHYITTLHELLTKIQKQIEFTREYENIGSHVPVWQNLPEILHFVRSQSPLPVKIKGCEIELFADSMLGKVFDTLLDNTLRHGGEGVSCIEVTCRKSGDGNYLVVWQDDGAGVPPGDKELIFERGFGKNTGLGLFLAREILAISGMEIKELSPAGEGGRFEIIVPESKYREVSG